MKEFNQISEVKFLSFIDSELNLVTFLVFVDYVVTVLIDDL